MIAVTPSRVQKDIAAVCALSQFNEHIRSHFLDEPDLSGEAGRVGAASYIAARGHLAEPLQWKVFSHCASVTRLYALYEGFVYELISEWLKMVPALYGAYEQLPEPILKNHRAGVGALLQKLGQGARTEHLTELSIVKALYLGRSGDRNFELVADAFFIDLRNLRHGELCTLFSKVSIENLGSWLDGHSELKSLCEGTTVLARLNELVDYRNEASHAKEEIDETLGVAAFKQIADFVQALCAALQQFVALRHMDVLQQSGRLERLGTVTEFFEVPDAAILQASGAFSLAPGDVIVAVGTHRYMDARVVSLQENDNDVISIKAVADAEIGLRSEPSLAKGLHVFRVLPRAAREDEAAVPPAEPAAPAGLQIDATAEAPELAPPAPAPVVAETPPAAAQASVPPAADQAERAPKMPWWQRLVNWKGKEG